MSDFIAELSDRELATIVSGTPLNNTDGGDVGCNHPIYERSIPACQTADSPVGLRQFGFFPVSYPSGIILAASFNKDLARAYGESIGYECVYYDVDFLLGPAINIFRNPAGGRNSAYYSEDPYLAGFLAAHYVNGLEDNGVGTCVKHYACNSQEHARTVNSSEISLRALNEIYLRVFKYTLQYSNPTAIMTSYNRINGEYINFDMMILYIKRLV